MLKEKKKTAVLYLPHWWSLIRACLGACVRTHFACVLAPPISHSMYFLGSRNTRKNLKPWFARLHNAVIPVFLCGMINPKVYQFIYNINFIDSAYIFHPNCVDFHTIDYYQIIDIFCYYGHAWLWCYIVLSLAVKCNYICIKYTYNFPCKIRWWRCIVAFRRKAGRSELGLFLRQDNSGSPAGKIQ